MRWLAVNPSVGVRRQLPLHKGAVFAFLHRTCRARQRNMGVADRHRGSAVWVQRHAGGVSPPPYSPRLYGLLASMLRLCRQGPGCSLRRVPQKRPVVCTQAKKSPPCAKGGQHGAAMQGGLCNPGSVQIKRLPVRSLFIRHCSALCLGLHLVSCRCWLASTGAQEQTTHTAFSEFWVPRHWAWTKKTVRVVVG